VSASPFPKLSRQTDMRRSVDTPCAFNVIFHKSPSAASVWILLGEKPKSCSPSWMSNLEFVFAQNDTLRLDRVRCTRPRMSIKILHSSSLLLGKPRSLHLKNARRHYHVLPVSLRLQNYIGSGTCATWQSCNKHDIL
jgi:hypothetical protein